MGHMFECACGTRSFDIILGKDLIFRCGNQLCCLEYTINDLRVEAEVNESESDVESLVAEDIDDENEDDDNIFEIE